MARITATTWNGIGTQFRNWRHFDDGTSEATRWLVLCFLPLLPMGRCSLVVNQPTDEGIDQPSVLTTNWIRISDEFRILEWRPVRWRDVVWTYVCSYVLVPVVVLAPLAVLVPFARYADQFHSDVPAQIAYSLILVWFFVYVGGILAFFLHRSRGG